MSELLKDDIRTLLQAFPIKEDIIDIKNIVGCSNAKDKMYESYKKNIPLLGVQSDEVIENVKPFFQDFNIRRFWFKDSQNKIAIKEGQTMAFQEGINIILKPGMYVDGGEAEESKKEDRYKEFVYVYYPQKIKLAIENFYVYTYGEYLLRNTNQPIIRFYFSLVPDVSKVRTLTNEIREYFNQRKIPFQYKTPHKLANFGRADTLVLYVAQNHYFYVIEFIISLIKANTDILRKEIPLFVKEIAKGVGFAEDPFFAGKDSFGEHRCALVYEAINEIAKNNKTVSIDEIIDYIKTKGYNTEEFYRNPYTNFDYSFDKESKENVFDMRIGKIYYFPYNRVALNCGLELMERAVWIDKNTFTWFSYNEDGGQKFYKMLDENEKLEIFSFLDKLLKIKYNRSRFPQKVIRIIEEKVGDYKKNQTNYSENLKELLKESKESYQEILDSLSSIDEADVSSLFSKSKTFLQKIAIDRTKIYSMIEDNVNEFIDSWSSANTTSEHIHGIDIMKLSKSEVFREATRIYYKYAKPNYPITNKFTNYEYCPTSKGKLQMGIIMLFVYCPSLFEEPPQQKES
ncbi:hypothetical protein LV89_00438 [Arcicella aurantiaca]|uniref:Uncharacterized protein n=1 Tax=Arcicella aurantiaca TaxID=591202 RepID=A0A316EHC8_9BACT|nr:T3SS effector HopA1 family protein [Arcicella aurantiaca]PWK28885.1 hypothetical protein LV89_00438 [Arcicella aurantiaca]